MQIKLPDKGVNEMVAVCAKLELIEFLGVIKILNINPYSDIDKKELKEFDTIFAEIISKFTSLPRKSRRQFLQVIKNANKEKKKYNGQQENLL